MWIFQPNPSVLEPKENENLFLLTDRDNLCLPSSLHLSYLVLSYKLPWMSATGGRSSPRNPSLLWLQEYNLNSLRRRGNVTVSLFSAFRERKRGRRRRPWWMAVNWRNTHIFTLLDKESCRLWTSLRLKTFSATANGSMFVLRKINSVEERNQK